MCYNCCIDSTGKETLNKEKILKYIIKNNGDVEGLKCFNKKGRLLIVILAKLFIKQIKAPKMGVKIVDGEDVQSWVFITQNELMAQLECSKRWIYTITKSLLDKGFVRRAKLSDRATNHTYYYNFSDDLYNEVASFSKKKHSTTISSNLKKKKNKSKEYNNPKKKKEEAPRCRECDRPTIVQDMLKIWNDVLGRQDRITKSLAPYMVQAFKDRFKTMSAFRSYCLRIKSSYYLNNPKFKLFIKWALKFKTIERVFKGKYGCFRYIEQEPSIKADVSFSSASKILGIFQQDEPIVKRSEGFKSLLGLKIKGKSLFTEDDLKRIQEREREEEERKKLESLQENEKGNDQLDWLENIQAELEENENISVSDLLERLFEKKNKINFSKRNTRMQYIEKICALLFYGATCDPEIIEEIKGRVVRALEDLFVEIGDSVPQMTRDELAKKVFGVAFRCGANRKSLTIIITRERNGKQNGKQTDPIFEK